MSDREQQKRHAAERAVEYVVSGMRLGLGTGSTAKHVLDVLSEKLQSGDLRDIAGVPTSQQTASYARTLGIPLLELDDVQHLDLAIDGADEVDPQLDLIKGLGAALLWEKIVESCAAQFVVVVDESKLVPRLATKAPVPVEVVQFGWKTLLPRFEAELVHARGHLGDGGIEEGCHVDRRPSRVDRGRGLHHLHGELVECLPHARGLEEVVDCRLHQLRARARLHHLLGHPVGYEVDDRGRSG